MDKDDEFKPRLGKQRSRGKARKYLGRVMASANLARGGLNGRGGRSFIGSRIGRGAGVGSLLGSGEGRSAFQRRRVIVKSRIVRLSGKGHAGAKAHLRYIQRDGTTREGAPGDLYGQDADRADGKEFLERSAGDRHQFRFIVSAEDGQEYDELKTLTRRLMAQMEEDLGTRLEWVAVDHYNTGHPHTHIMLRGKDECGRDLVIAPEYIKHGMRQRAVELVDLDLGPKTVEAARRQLQAEMEQERLTGIDRALLREARDGLVSTAGRGGFEQSVRTGRLRKLERLGLAHRVTGPVWRLSPEMRGALTALGERGDIIRTMQRALAAAGREMPPAIDHAIYDPRSEPARPLDGRLVERGLSDEINDRHYLIVEATDGRTYYADVGVGDAAEPMGEGAIVRIEPARIGIRRADRTVAEVAAANGGRYDAEAHLVHDPTASEEFVRSHVRRLEAIRRLTGGVERDQDGSWIISGDHLERAAAYEKERARHTPVAVTILSSQPLEKLIHADAATWLDQELVSDTPEPLRDAGFGRQAGSALAARRQWLIEQQLATEQDSATAYRPDLVEVLRRRELLREASQLSDELGMPFGESSVGVRVEGRLVRSVDLLSGRQALIERSQDFTLVPWRPVFERQLGKQVSGVLGQERTSWTIGRGREGPSIS